MAKHFHCPVNGLDCPHYKDRMVISGREEEGICTLSNPYQDCDDFYSMYGDDCTPEDYTDNGEDTCATCGNYACGYQLCFRKFQPEPQHPSYSCKYWKEKEI